MHLCVHVYSISKPVRNLNLPLVRSRLEAITFPSPSEGLTCSCPRTYTHTHTHTHTQTQTHTHECKIVELLWLVQLWWSLLPFQYCILNYFLLLITCSFVHIWSHILNLQEWTLSSPFLNCHTFWPYVNVFDCIKLIKSKERFTNAFCLRVLECMFSCVFRSTVLFSAA